MWTWRLTLQSPPAAWYLGCWYWQGANHLLRVEQQVWPFWPYSDRCCQCHVWLLWPDMLWLLPRPSAVRVAAAVRPGYRRPASSHSGAAEAARWWPAGTSCPVHRSEDKCQNRSWSWCREHTSTFYCMWPIFYDTGTIYILPVFTVSPECCEPARETRNVMSFKIQNNSMAFRYWIRKPQIEIK